MKALDRFANAVPLAGAAATGPRAFQATLAAAGADPQPLALSLSGAPGAPDLFNLWGLARVWMILNRELPCVCGEWRWAPFHTQLCMVATKCQCRKAAKADAQPHGRARCLEVWVLNVTNTMVHLQMALKHLLRSCSVMAMVPRPHGAHWEPDLPGRHAKRSACYTMPGREGRRNLVSLPAVFIDIRSLCANSARRRSVCRAGGALCGAARGACDSGRHACGRPYQGLPVAGAVLLSPKQVCCRAARTHALPQTSGPFGKTRLFDGRQFKRSWFGALKSLLGDSLQVVMPPVRGWVASPPAFPHTSHLTTQVAVLPGKGCARASAVHGLPAQLVAGDPVALRIVLADEHGNRTTSGGDAVVVSADSAREGSAAVPVQARLP